MKNKSIKIISFILTMIVAVSCAVIPGSAAQQKDVKMIILGDSVAYGAYVDSQYRFGEVLASKLENDGYNVDYTNYAVPKYGTRSVYYDLYEETYNYDHNRYIEDHGAKNLREGVDYAKFIGDVSTSDIIIIHLGENDLAAAFYDLRGYPDYYMFYGDEINIPLLQKDIDEHNVASTLALNEFKIARVKAKFEKTLRYYLDLDIKRIKELNPDAQIIVCDMLNPYKKASDGMNYMIDLMKAIPVHALGLLKAEGIYDFFDKFAALTAEYNTCIQTMHIMIPALTGKDLDHCAKFDLSPLSTAEKILYKIQYLRVEAACVEMYDIADIAIPEVANANNVTLCELSKTDACNHMAPDGSHPDIDGHAIIADSLYSVIDFEKIA